MPTENNLEPKTVILSSNTIEQSLGLAKQIGRNRERISLGSPQQIGNNKFSLEIIKGTIEDFRKMIKAVPSIKIIEEIIKDDNGITVILTSFLAKDPTEE